MRQNGSNGWATRRYASPTDGPARALTLVLVLTAVGAALVFGFMSPLHQIVSGLFLAFVALLLVTAYNFRPIGYGMDAEGVTVYFPFRRLRIPWPTVESVRLEPKEKSFRPIRVFGSGGVLGYIGRYWSPALGFHIRLVTDRRRVVILDRRVPYCLSPDDPDRFVREARGFLDDRANDPSRRATRPRVRSGA